MQPASLTALLLTALVGNALVTLPAAGENSGNIEGDYRPEDGGWRFILSPYALLANQSTDVGGQRIRQDFEDISSMTNAGFLIAGTVICDRWRLGPRLRLVVHQHLQGLPPAVHHGRIPPVPLSADRA